MILSQHMSVSLETSICGLGPLSRPIFNAAGASCIELGELVALSESSSGAVISKSCTLEPRTGNPHPRYWAQYTPGKNLITTNSTGLANLGYKYYDLRNNADLLDKLGSSPKPYIISVAGLSQQDNIRIIKDLFEVPSQYSQRQAIKSCSGVELNLSCPNIIGKPQTGYDLEASRELLRKLLHQTEWDSDNAPVLGLKLPVYLDSAQLGQMADLVKEFPVSWITCINSPGNGLIIDPETERPVIRPRGGLGGIGGSVIKSLALGNVYQFARELGPACDVIGCGGVMTGTDVFEHLLVGAKAVQVGSLLVETGPGVFDTLNQELKEIMMQKGYSDISAFQGRLQPYLC